MKKKLATQEMVKAFLAAKTSRGLSPKTLGLDRWTLGLLGQRFAKLPTGPEALEELLGSLGGSRETKHGHWRRLRTFFRWCGRRYGSPNPMTEISAPRRLKRPPRVLTVEQVQHLLGCCRDMRDRSLLELLLDTGIRIGEAWALRTPDILQETVIVDGKTGQREVPISPQVRGLLLETPLPWEGAKGPLSLSGLKQVVIRVVARAGITGPKHGPHLLRHTFARLYILAGGDPFSLREILGHTSVETTQIYVGMDRLAVIAQHAKYSPMRSLSRSLNLL
jgi:integrase/recombinase XerD